MTKGSITVYYGPMFSGKTTKLLHVITGADKAKLSYVLLKKANHREEDLVSSHSGDGASAQELDQLSQLDESLFDTTDVFLIDEGQFFEDLCGFLRKARAAGKICFIAMLDGTWEREPWPVFGGAIALATESEKCYAFCHYCGVRAPFSMKIAGDNKLVDHTSANYVPVCDPHWRRCIE